MPGQVILPSVGLFVVGFGERGSVKRQDLRVASWPREGLLRRDEGDLLGSAGGNGAETSSCDGSVRREATNKARSSLEDAPNKPPVVSGFWFWMAIHSCRP